MQPGLFSVKSIDSSQFLPLQQFLMCEFPTILAHLFFRSWVLTSTGLGLSEVVESGGAGGSLGWGR